MLVFRCLPAHSSIERRTPFRFLVWARLVTLVAAALVLLAGCYHDGDGEHDHEDDFIVSFPSPLEIDIHRPFDRPFDVIEIGVAPFISPGFGAEPYALVVSGIAWFDGTEIVFEAQDLVSQVFIDPLGERVVDVLITCDCFVDFVTLRSGFGETTLFFD